MSDRLFVLIYVGYFLEFLNRSMSMFTKQFNQLERVFCESVNFSAITSDILIVATGAQNPTVSKELIYSKKDLLILDLSIPKNVSEDVEELPNVQLIHLDHLSQMTDETLERRKQFIPQAKEIIAEVENDFNQWLETRKFAPTIKALKKKLRSMKDDELDFQRKKMSDFNDEHAEIVSNRIIQKIMKHFANHLKGDTETTDESLELIHKVFQLEEVSK